MNGVAIGLFILTTVGFAGDANAPHPHQGILPSFDGAPPIPELTEEDVAILNKGKNVLKQQRGSGGGRGVAVQDIHAPTDIVWNRITDYGAYPRMVENVKECENYEVKGDRIKTRFLIGALWLNIEYFIDHIYHPEEGYLTWTLDYSKTSDLDDSVGFWRVHAVPEKPGWTRVFYSIDLRPKGWMPKSMENMLITQGLVKATAWVKRESEQQAQNAKPE